ncbi:MAG: carboxypeptidase regulatory-like domain-containing protein [Acidobacteria bacterium]|nr:carboxypeptidase regulatory-like domain-containing protein [Acidobacteriota bacterium]
MQGVLRVLVSALTLCAVQAVSSACIIFSDPIHVGSNFRLRVTDRGRPVPSLPVALFHGRTVKRRAVTDRDGIARFVNVPEEKFLAGPDHPARSWSLVTIEVHSNRNSQATIPVRWPDVPPAVTKSLTGVIGESRLGELSQPGLALELLDGRSGRVLHATQTNENGAFQFPAVGRGLYFLHIGDAEDGGDGYIPVDVRPETDVPALRLALSWTDCGLFFANLAECPRGDLRLARLSGTVTDASDGVIAEAAIVLVDEAGKEVQGTRSDSMGRFGPLELAAGRYELRIVRAGFTLLETPVTIDPQGDQGPLDVRLGLMGACSTAKLR